jgi:hypothetical protein
VKPLSRVFLCGGIHGLADEECQHWRHVAQVKLEGLGYLVHNPLQHFDARGRDLSFGQIRRMVESDENGVDWCDTLLLKAEGAGLGSGGELYRAFVQRKYIVAWGRPSPTATYRATVLFPGLYEALEHYRELRERAA